MTYTYTLQLTGSCGPLEPPAPDAHPVMIAPYGMGGIWVLWKSTQEPADEQKAANLKGRAGRRGKRAKLTLRKA